MNLVVVHFFSEKVSLDLSQNRKNSTKTKNHGSTTLIIVSRIKSIKRYIIYHRVFRSLLRSSYGASSARFYKVKEKGILR